ncbi:cytochrome c-type biogenesis protein [Solemya pervernicosa gill symbiont]|uniref:cytochrome c-type biogenesis protein n=1 Tax=Solemya pervernicosa gill symbiont TaxID=642797 RepID=UPI0038B5396F
MRSLLTTILLLVTLPISAAINSYEFNTPEEEQTFKELSSELRCLVCQNQNLEDSNAELAQDLRDKVYKMVQRGDSKSQITDYMVERYGDFVLYRPPVKPSTYILWFSPLVLIAVGLFMLIRFIRRRTATADAPLSNEERERLQDILKEKDS